MFFCGHQLKEGVRTFFHSCCALPENLWSALIFLLRAYPQKITFWQKFLLLARFFAVSLRVRCLHKQSEILKVAGAILALPPGIEGCVVEAGCYKGGSSIKLSLACKLARRRLVVFDSFAGLPEDEASGCKIRFSKHDYRASLNEVMNNVRRLGALEVCRFQAGWFEETLPKFTDNIAVIYLDVDLASSTQTCLQYLYPLLVLGGVLFSHDGHLPLVVEVFNDERFWADMVGIAKPSTRGLKHSKLIKIVKHSQV